MFIPPLIGHWSRLISWKRRPSGHTTVKTIAGQANITKTTLQTLAGVGDIKKTTLQTLAGTSEIRKVVSQNISGTACIKATTVKQLLGNAAIQQTVTRPIAGQSAIRQTVLKTQAGQSRIAKRVTKTISGISDISVPRTTRTLAGVADIKATTKRTLAGRAVIAVPTMRLLNVQVQASTFANQILFLGGFFGVGGIELRGVANDTASQTALGRVISAIVVDRTLSTQGAVNLAAGIELSAREAQYSIAFETDFDGLEVGMLVNIVSVNGGISGSYVINTLSIRQRSLTSTVYSCIVGSYRGSLAERLRALANLKTLESAVPPPPNSVGSGQLQNGAVGSLQLAAAAVQTSNIAVAAITGAVIAASTITVTQIADNAITTPKIIAGAVVTTSLAAGSVTGVKILAGSITAANAVFGTGAILTADIGTAQITDAKIATLSASKLTAGTIDASVITVTNLSASNITTGTFSASRISSGTAAIGGGKVVINGTGTTAFEVFGGVACHNEFSVDGNALVSTDFTVSGRTFLQAVNCNVITCAGINSLGGIVCTDLNFSGSVFGAGIGRFDGGLSVLGTIIVDTSGNCTVNTVRIGGNQVVTNRQTGPGVPSFASVADAQTWCAALRTALVTHGLIT